MQTRGAVVLLLNRNDRVLRSLEMSVYSTESVRRKSRACAWKVNHLVEMGCFPGGNNPHEAVTAPESANAEAGLANEDFPSTTNQSQFVPRRPLSVWSTFHRWPNGRCGPAEAGTLSNGESFHELAAQ